MHAWTIDTKYDEWDCVCCCLRFAGFVIMRCGCDTAGPTDAVAMQLLTHTVCLWNTGWALFGPEHVNSCWLHNDIHPLIHNFMSINWFMNTLLCTEDKYLVNVRRKKNNDIHSFINY